MKSVIPSSRSAYSPSKEGEAWPCPHAVPGVCSQACQARGGGERPHLVRGCGAALQELLGRCWRVSLRRI